MSGYKKMHGDHKRKGVVGSFCLEQGVSMQNRIFYSNFNHGFKESVLFRGKLTKIKCF